MIFVFGSNLAGRHGKGAALDARREWGAEFGIGEGRTGDSYAIPTKGWRLEILPLGIIAQKVNRFIEYAKNHPELEFFVTRVGCGLAGYKDSEMSPMFKDCPKNCRLPKEWNEINN